jgi:class 3 adenylate cyclase
MPPVRRLTAILASDVAGYSRLMEVDEEGTHERLKAHLGELVTPKIEEHRSRFWKIGRWYWRAPRAPPGRSTQRYRKLLGHRDGPVREQLRHDEVEGKSPLQSHGRRCAGTAGGTRNGDAQARISGSWGVSLSHGAIGERR